MSIKDNIKNVTSEILEHLLSAVDNIASASLSKKEAYKILYGYSDREWSFSNISHRLHNLKKAGYVEIKEKNGQNSIILTNKTKVKLIDKIADKCEVDDKFRFVSFDVPEDLRTQRDKFRRAIKSLGFKQVQKSLWVCNKNVGELVEIASYEFGVEKYMIYIVSEKSDVDGLLSKLMG